MRSKLAFHLFLGLFGLSVLCSSVLVLGFYAVARHEKEADYRERYAHLSESLSATFQELERTSRMMNDNAARVLQEIVAQRGLPSHEELLVLAAALHVQSLDITNKAGRFVRSPVVPMSQQTLSLFDYCPDYENLITGTSNYETTPIMPGFPDLVPRMYTMIPSHDRQFIIESTVTLGFIYDIMQSALKRDANVTNMGLVAPNGKELGRVHAAEHSNEIQFALRVPSGVAECCECEFKGTAATTAGTPYFYTLQMSVSTEALQENIAQLRINCCTVAIVALLGSALVAWLLGQRLARRIVSMSFTAKRILESNDLSLRIEPGVTQDEVKELAETVNAMLDGLQQSREAAIEHERLTTLARVAGQVAHDIRSPLTALNTVLVDLHALPERTRLLARSAIYRVQDIANALLRTHRGDEAEERSISLLFSIVDSLVSEKRAEYRARLGIELSVEVGSGGASAFANVSPARFKRVLSNLINNAVEAMEKTGAVTLRLSADSTSAFVEVSDNGRGIPEEIFAKLGQEGVTHGKAGGHGMGVSAAMECVRAWGGSLTYTSVVGEGTQAMLRLPRSTPPLWFIEAIDLRNIKRVVVADDDSSIHGVWRGRIDKASGTGIEIVHLSSPADFRAWCEANENLDDVFMLVDFEFIGHVENGLDLIEGHALQDKAVLVTSRFEEPVVLARCLRSGIRLVPKPVAAHLPIVCEQSQHTDAVLIDDDPLVHSMWELNAATKGKRFVGFRSWQEFLSHQAGLQRHTPIYVDANLGNGQRGEILSKDIADLGFEEIYLATGYSASEFEPMPWIRNVCGKNGPF